MTIHNHSYTEAIQSPSPNYTNRTIVPVFIVMHYTAGWTAESAIETFASPQSKVSAQFTIDVDGTVYQHVPANKRAWHAGPSSYAGLKDLNTHSIGIEFVNPGFLRKVGDDLYQDAAKNRVSGTEIGPMVAATSKRAGSGMFYWPAYTRAQIDAGEALVRDLISSYPIRDIVSHEEIDTRGWKTDPGPTFPMSRFKALLPKVTRPVVQYEVTTDVLNVRSGPGTANAVVSKLFRGNRVTALETVSPWVRISDRGWVSGDFLREAA